MLSHRIMAVLLTAGVVLAGCAGDEAGTTATAGTPTAPDDLAVVVASFDLSVGHDRRFLVGVLTPDRHVIGGGEVEMTFTHLGDNTGTDDDPRAAGTATGTFLPVPGTATPDDLGAPVVLGEPPDHDHGDGAHPGSQGADDHDHGSSSAAGVYQAAVDFDAPGFWEVAVTADLDGEERTGSTYFEVLPKAKVPEVGDPAPRTSTLRLDSDVPAEAIDSRAGPSTPVPDEILHQVDLLDALDTGRPAVVVFSTPTYCTSRFCGPITEAVEDLAHDYGDRAAFVHVEIWNDIEERRLNDAVQDWIATEDGGNEPWVFLVDADGTIAARWDNVLDISDLTARLRALPAD